MGTAAASDTSRPRTVSAPLISVKLQPFRLCQRFKLVNRTLEPHLTLGPDGRPMGPDGVREGALWSNARPRVLEWLLMVESERGAVAVGRTYLLPPLSFGGASLVRPWLRFHVPLIEPDMQIYRIRLSDKTSRSRVRRPLQFLNTFRS